MGSGDRVYILDAATLQRLQSFSHPLFDGAVAFSPDSRTLTSFIFYRKKWIAGGAIISWDLQTGCMVSNIHWGGSGDTGAEDAYITYSMNGRMVAALCRYKSSAVISIYDIVSGVYMHDVHHTHTNPGLGASYVYKIWTHGESLRFATPEPMGITIWEVGFTSGAIPVEVETVPIPKNVAQTAIQLKERGHIEKTEFHPASCRLASIRPGAEGDSLLVWDAWASKLLLRHTNIDSSDYTPHITFSSDGRFFACTTSRSEVCLWKESPAGYTLLEKFMSTTPNPYPSLSPNGESIVIFGDTTVRLWHTKGFTSSSPLVQAPNCTPEGFILEFSPGSRFGVTARKGDQVVTVLDLNSGVPQFTIDTSIDVYGLRPTGIAIVVIGHKKAISWNLPGEGFHPDTRMGIDDSTWTINFGSKHNKTVAASISPDFQHIALMRHGPPTERYFLDVYDTFTGQHLYTGVCPSKPWFVPGGRKIWCHRLDGEKVDVYTITQGALDRTRADVDIEDGSWGCPWRSSRGYKVTEDGWILGSGRKRLLMLPPLWRPQSKADRAWNEKFVALLHRELPELVILELEP